MSYPEWSDSDIEDYEYPNPPNDSLSDEWVDGVSDEYDDAHSEVLPCPECGSPIYEDTPSCPHCGCYVTFSSNFWSNRKTWWIWLGVAGIVAVVLALITGGF